ncbi:hypothetical protein KL921_003232 [Ogataea angusta]|uniref:Uncharacterized protein n=1 Tax=Pichia angusta TaxID=870730 RepID=A0AAN6I4C7_PICAN|nr:uncharacterized protein KL928_003469 [Ogataea angusta]KAG7809235.1 hypothetical protein KL921_003232 [Ogataea angusta]KAG7817570.1 hypothetical protein KL928_003469 [Ogataea angusta]KAG7818469.1 hypothetical protein KL909_005091 [Ogataea angusta]KAG7826888.1 hypothetical protein KL920_005149 [Ogataea angusta]KAG7833827.1 hypothetical protein KL943_003935 [Ogataea angusta]
MSRALGYSVLAVAAAAVGYCVYFDYARRNNPDFRKKIVKNKKRAAKKAKQEAEADKKQKLEALKEKLNQSLADEPLPKDAAEKEKFFMTQVTIGEQMSALEGKDIEAAIHFYKGLAVYPNPTGILDIYQRTIPEHIYELIMMLTAIQPPASVMNVLQDSIPSLDQD